MKIAFLRIENRCLESSGSCLLFKLLRSSLLKALAQYSLSALAILLLHNTAFLVRGLSLCYLAGGHEFESRKVVGDVGQVAGADACTSNWSA